MSIEMDGSISILSPKIVVRVSAPAGSVLSAELVARRRRNEVKRCDGVGFYPHLDGTEPPFIEGRGNRVEVRLHVRDEHETVGVRVSCLIRDQWVFVEKGRRRRTGGGADALDRDADPRHV